MIFKHSQWTRLVHQGQSPHPQFHSYHSPARSLYPNDLLNQSTVSHSLTHSYHSPIPLTCSTYQTCPNNTITHSPPISLTCPPTYSSLAQLSRLAQLSHHITFSPITQVPTYSCSAPSTYLAQPTDHIIYLPISCSPTYSTIPLIISTCLAQPAHHITHSPISLT